MPPAAIVASAGLVTLVTLYWPQPAADVRRPDAPALLLVAAMVLPLMWWRTRPLPAAMVSVGGALATGALQYPNNAGYYCAIASTAAAIYRDRRRIAWFFAGTAFLGTVAVSVAIGSRNGSGYTAFDFVLQVSVTLIPLILVELLRTRVALNAELRAQAALLLELNARDTREATIRERLRIGREVHDIVGHHLSAIRVQAGAGRMLAGTDPARAGESLALIADIASQALTQTRLAVARTREGLPSGADPHRGDGFAPQLPIEPRLADLPALLTAVRAIGLDVDVRVTGAERTLPPPAEAAAYRIVQEALTNVHRHCSISRASVSLHYGDALLQLAVSDHGQPSGRPGLPGHGLVGMRERAALVGGTLHAGPAPDAVGWLVTAALPAPVHP
ncbi:MAG TPA: histidine kinase [Catenuloplanes sp.]